MLSSLLWMVLTQIAWCTPGETTLVCSCKQGMVSACVTLAGQDALEAAQVLDGVQEALDAAQMAGAGDENKKKQLRAAAESLSQALGSSEPPDCKGQEHHLISRPIAKALSRHPVLKGLYTPRDPRFVAKAKDEPAHCGYQKWHRDVDEEVIAWLERYRNATPKDFMDKLREIYSRPDMQMRFPNGF